jgi:hypothetical protein
VPTGESFNFQRQNGDFIFQSSALQPRSQLALGGSDGAGSYCWNLARALSVTNSSGYQRATLQFLLPQSAPTAGSAVMINTTTFRFADSTVYWITQSGDSEPYWSGLKSFQHLLNKKLLMLQWQTQHTGSQIEVRL